eukprot:scaffold25411_cov152-Cylindrotheca_fusiformis.AAC.3
MKRQIQVGTAQRDTSSIDGEMLHKQQLQSKISSKRAALTDVEAAFLHALLIDPAEEEQPNASEEGDVLSDKRTPLIKAATRRLDDDMLFSIPSTLLSGKEAEDKRENDQTEQSPKKRPAVTKDPKDYRFLVGLWQAFEDGVSLKKFNHANMNRSHGIDSLEEKKDEEGPPLEEEDSTDGESAFSDVEVRAERANDESSYGSLGEDDYGLDHFDAWQVLKDEYSKDFGFDYSVDGTTPSLDDEDVEHSTFRILGTSADDTSAHPHVMSPPLMDAVITFLPDRLKGQNLWLKYSLLRDGASLETFKQYARASKDTIIAIETTKGHVFGSYTSAPWRTNPTFFGGDTSLVWKMRYNRNTPCHCLFEQAELESEIDVFLQLEVGEKPQCCTSNKLGIGAGKLIDYDLDGYGIGTDSDNEGDGFAFALEDDLLSGTTSKCQTYKNPCLVDGSSTIETFEVLNLELWTFTPCFSLDSSEKLEMTQFFMSESIRSASLMSERSQRSRSDSIFGSRDLDQNLFYRRIGHEDANEELRERWHYRNMMDGDLTRS